VLFNRNDHGDDSSAISQNDLDACHGLTVTGVYSFGVMTQV